MANKPLANDNPERGWGQMLPQFLTDNVVFDNRAVNGRSTKSYIDPNYGNLFTIRLKKGTMFSFNSDITTEKLLILHAIPIPILPNVTT